jgi:hypothetical protein
MRILGKEYDPLTGVTTTYGAEDGKIVVKTEQDVAPHLDYSIGLQNNPEYAKQGIKKNFQHVAHIPNVVVAKMLTEDGFDLLKANTREVPAQEPRQIRLPPDHGRQVLMKDQEYHKYIESLLDTEPDDAARRCVELLNEDCDDYQALFMIGVVYLRAEKHGLAALHFKRVTELIPKRSEPWNNLGMCYSGLKSHQKARQAYTKAWERDKRALYAANVGVTHMEERDYKRAVEWSDIALRMDATCSTALNTRGLSRIATGQWKDGWADCRASIGGKFRKRLQYLDEEMWDGTPGKTIVVYGEQGIGDEIMYASCVPDAAKDCTVVLECDRRLQGLFRRSFPQVTVYGTRLAKEIEWPNKHKIEANIPCGQLPEYYRQTPASCPGTPYLVADPERRLQWRALFDSWGPRPKIGIAWSGGSRHNNPAARNAGVEAFRPLIQAIDADWVSLQYKDPTREIEEAALPVRHFRRACETDDYDDTAALVAELDLVIGVHTSAQHLAGALGVPGVVLVNDKSNWNYQIEPMPWYRSARLFRQRGGETWAQTIERLSNDPDLLRLRSARIGGVSRIQPVGDPDRYLPGSVLSPCPELAA